MLLNIAVCDDEISEIKKIEDYLMTFSVQSGIEFNIEKYSDGNNLLSAYNGNSSKYDVFFRCGNAKAQRYEIS